MVNYVALCCSNSTRHVCATFRPLKLIMAILDYAHDRMWSATVHFRSGPEAALCSFRGEYMSGLFLTEANLHRADRVITRRNCIKNNLSRLQIVFHFWKQWKKKSFNYVAYSSMVEGQNIKAHHHRSSLSMFITSVERKKYTNIWESSTRVQFMFKGCISGEVSFHRPL